MTVVFDNDAKIMLFFQFRKQCNYLFANYTASMH